MSTTDAQTHLVLIWERALGTYDRIHADAARRFTIRDAVRVTWTPSRFRRSLSRLYGTDLPPDSHKERECGTGPFVVLVVDDHDPHAVARRSQGTWTAANAHLLAAKRRYRRWARGSYAVHTTLTETEARKDAMLVLGETLEDLHGRSWNGEVRERRRDLLGEPAWESLAELEAALTATMHCVVTPPEPSGQVTVVTDDPWWAIRIVDPDAADGTADAEARQRHVLVGGVERSILVRDATDPDLDSTWATIPESAPDRVLPTFGDRLATLVRRRA